MIELCEKRPAESKNNMKILALGFLAALMAVSLMLMAKPARADITNLTFTVNSTADPGSGGCNLSECTLREAIALSNRVAGADTIKFDIPGEGVKTISPTSELPVITEAVTIDGCTQLGASPNTLAKGTNAQIMVELDGSLAGVFGDGLRISASNVVVRGLAINRFDGGGIELSDDTSGVKVEGNFIGTDPSGTQNLGNKSRGVEIGGVGNSIVGGTTPASRNLISGNFIGVIVFGEGGEVQGNLIGTSKDGTSPLGNSRAGVRISGVSSKNNTIGGTGSGSANTIAFNGGDGVEVSFDSTGNRVLRNSIFSNDELGIELDSDGPTANDVGDADAGPNGLQNKPGLISAITSGGEITIKGKLLSKPNRTFVVRFFSNPSGENEGKTFIGQKKVTTSSEGKVSFAFTPARKVGAGTTITATATGLEGTSEFSAPRTVVSAQ